MNEIFKSLVEEQNKLATEFAENIDLMTTLQENDMNKNNYLKNENNTSNIVNDNKDNKDNKPKRIDTATIVKGLLSSPLGQFDEYLFQSIKYLRQKQSEKVKDLTKDLLQDVRDSFLIKLAEHQSKISTVIIDVMTALTLISKNISVSIKGSGGNSNDTNRDYEKVEKTIENATQMLSPKYNI